ncbi:replication protein P [Rheinheimera sp. MMS21-TC3]|uniref:replication protein P n=1 Tax=Rheinheimera sp. MMS21-TC3 TaxID=3072790 RepID=UPI0028C4528E|nr:replication protein P [Rheinheimera sp. MMS21-TC3]WNO60424.1 replication protein P [Rheinheimera sp. MMS21-TC3]
MQEKQQNELKARVAQATEKLKAELLPVLVLYYPIFAAQHCSDDKNLQAVMAQFAERMIAEGVTLKGFMYGVEQLKKRAGSSAFILNPQAFAELCRGNTGNSLPTLREVTDEIIQRRGREKHNDQFKFSHELTRLINVRVGAMIYELINMEFERTVKKEYESWVKRLEAGEELPQPQKCLGNLTKPDLPAYLQEKLKPTCKAAKLAAANARREV